MVAERGGDECQTESIQHQGDSSQAQKRRKQGPSTQQNHGRSADHRNETPSSGSQSNSFRNNSDDSSSPAKSRGAYTAEEYQRSQYHIPNTRANQRSPSPNGDKEEHYILTLLTDQSLHDYMTKLRKKYFPSKINRIDAHITLFHALPGSHLGEIVEDIRSLCSDQTPFPITAEGPTSPRKKTILISASSPRFAVQGVQKNLKGKWSEWLSEQDAGGFRPHYTVLNKVDDEKEVERKFKECKEEFEKKEGEVMGLVLWRYDRGSWTDKKVFKFGESENQEN